MGYTNFPTTGSPGIIDLFLVKNGFPRTLPMSHAELSSDHNPVSMTVDFDYKNLLTKKIFDYKKADWYKFREDINNELDLNFYIHMKSDLESHTNFFVKKLTKLSKEMSRWFKSKIIYIFYRTLLKL